MDVLCDRRSDPHMVETVSWSVCKNNDRQFDDSHPVGPKEKLVRIHDESSCAGISWSHNPPANLALVERIEMAMTMMMMMMIMGLGEGTKIILPLQGTDTYGALLKNIIDVWASDTPLVAHDYPCCRFELTHHIRNCRVKLD